MDDVCAQGSNRHGPLAAADRPAIIAHPDTLHLSTTTEGDTTRCFMNGNELTGYDLILPAQMDVLRPES